MEAKRWYPEINEDLGEVLCDECGGRGWKHGEMVEYSTMQPGVTASCKKCRGTGKLDWIERIVGKRPHRLSARFNCFGLSEIPEIRTSIDGEIIKRIAEQMSADIDREIMETLMVSKEVPGEER